MPAFAPPGACRGLKNAAKLGRSPPLDNRAPPRTHTHSLRPPRSPDATSISPTRTHPTMPSTPTSTHTLRSYHNPNTSSSAPALVDSRSHLHPPPPLHQSPAHTPIPLHTLTHARPEQAPSHLPSVPTLLHAHEASTSSPPQTGHGFVNSVPGTQLTAPPAPVPQG